MSFTPNDPHFVSSATPRINRKHIIVKPHKTAPQLFRAVAGTAFFRTWRSMIFVGIWTSIIVVIDKTTTAGLKIPSTLVTVLGVVLGLTLSYRISSAYDRYYEGRSMWGQVVAACRLWSSSIWIYCPDANPFKDNTPEERAASEYKTMVEKETMVRMALTFAIALKHYLRGEGGIFYEDLYDLVKFLPTLNESASGSNKLESIPEGSESSQSSPLAKLHPTYVQVFEHDPEEPFDYPLRQYQSGTHARPVLRPSRDPPLILWQDVWPIPYFLGPKSRIQSERRKELNRAMREGRLQDVVSCLIPVTITRYMYNYMAKLDHRHMVSDVALGRMSVALERLDEAMYRLERIVTTPIPFSFKVHVWTIAYLYCLLMPFQLCWDNFGWACIPAVMLVTLIVIGFGEIAAEIENPFGYDRNDINLDYIVNTVIHDELMDLISEPFPDTDDWIFNSLNERYDPSQFRKVDAARSPS